MGANRPARLLVQRGAAAAPPLLVVARRAAAAAAFALALWPPPLLGRRRRRFRFGRRGRARLCAAIDIVVVVGVVVVGVVVTAAVVGRVGRRRGRVVAAHERQAEREDDERDARPDLCARRATPPHATSHMNMHL